MKRWLLIMILCGSPVTILDLHAQQLPPGKSIFPFACDYCGVWADVDLPRPGATVTDGAVLHGWGQSCFDGKPIQRVEIIYEDDAGKPVTLLQPVGVLARGFYRPDVFNFLKALCPSPNDYDGWQLRLVNLPPAGARRLQINVWYGPYLLPIYRTYNFQPNARLQ